MCLPAAALPAMAIASSVVSGFGQVMAGNQADQQGRYEASMAKRNAKLEVEAAHDSYLTGVDERADFWRKISQVKGQQIASMSANGIDVGEGAGAMVQADTQMLANADAKNLYRNIEERTRGRYINASNYVAEAKAARARGKSAKIGSYVGAFGTVLGGISQASALKSKMGTSRAENN